jgi:6-phosphogluconolactonase (cycloisomerase 2 family)
MSNALTGAVFVQTNDADANAVVVFERRADGSLARLGTHATGGLGNGTPHLPSQGSIVVAAEGSRLLVANAGSDDVSVFAVSGDGLVLLDRVSSQGKAPRSVAVHGDLVYVLNAGGDGPGSVTGFRLAADGALVAIAGSARPLSADEADGAQVAFDPTGQTLVVTERVTDRLSTYAVRADGTLDGPIVRSSPGATPYGFDFSPDGVLVVTEAFGGQAGAAAASSYVLEGAGARPVSESVGNTRSEVCWAVVGKDGRHAYVTNFGDGTISSYRISADGSLELLEPVAAETRLGEKGIRDAALSADGSFLYALDADSQEVYAWLVGDGGKLAPVGAVDGLPATVAGLAAL